MNIDIIKKRISRHRIISFDIFDTLLKRCAMRPEDVFEVVGNKFNLPNFKQKRLEAEKLARICSEKEDVTLDDIYEKLPFDEEDKALIKKTEMEVEDEFLIANTQLKELFDYAISLSKAVIIVSDMYLPFLFVKKQLEKCGYKNYFKLYVSSEIGLVKSSGNLFKYILNENKWRPCDILHIGDGKKSDFLAPVKLGIHINPIKTTEHHTIYSKSHKINDLNHSILYAFINNTIPLNENRYNAIGYEALGPLLFGFCKWLHEHKQAKDINRLLFFSRDGQLIHKAYSIIYPNDKAEYVYLSRRSLTVPLIHKQKSLSEILNIIPVNWYTEIGVVIDRLGLEYDKYDNVVKKNGLNKRMKLTKDEYLTDSRFLNLFSEIKDDIYENSIKEYNAFLSFIKRLSLSERDACVDIGWKGTIQLTLERILLELGVPNPMSVFYMGTFLGRENAYGYIFDTKNTKYKMALLSFNGFFETLFSANHGSVKRYKNSGEIELYPFEFDANSKTKEDYSLICKIQEGAMTFIKNAVKCQAIEYMNWNNMLAFKAIERLGTSPQRADLKRLGDLCFFDNKIMLLAHPTKRGMFSLKKEFAASTWKIAYLRRLLKIPFPYLKLYEFLRKCMNR